ncbi:MAG: cation acetate symporter [Spirochaetes bacterium GWF2_52_7]|nr:MAG: cation acetate symporter [Spirochaetes bacterium GWF2_52_7]
MTYDPSILATLLFSIIVIIVLAISIYFSRQASSSKGYFAAGGTIPWTINGVAFAGDYLSAASFLGICGMIALSGYDGFLYSIGYLAGWIVALFVIAEPLKRLGKFTFADALDSHFNYPTIRLVAGISTLVVSIFYLIPQMVGAGALVTPLLGFPHWVGVVFVGGLVIFIVATAGMKATTYVQFIKGTLLIVFSLVLVIAILGKGLATSPSESYHEFVTLTGSIQDGKIIGIDEPGYSITGEVTAKGHTFVRLERDEVERWYLSDTTSGKALLTETLTVVSAPGSVTLYNGLPKEAEAFYQVGHVDTLIVNGEEVSATGPIGPFTYIETIEDSTVIRFIGISFTFEDESVALWYQEPTAGTELMRPGLEFKVDKGSTPLSKLNFVSLMVALFFGTSALPHVLIRYYTVPSPKDARKSTILAIAAIGFFYVLTLYIGFGAMVNGVIDVQNSNMSAPLLAKSFGVLLFAVISAIAFATVLGTVSGLIVAASGAVAHDMMKSLFRRRDITDEQRVVIGKIAAIVVGGIAIVLGILFEGMNVSFLVGLAFSTAASANFPAIIMMLFWKKTTAKGIVASVLVGMVSSLAIILVSPSMFVRYGMDPASSPIGLDNPAIISIPLSFIALVVVSLITKKKKA